MSVIISSHKLLHFHNERSGPKHALIISILLPHVIVVKAGPILPDTVVQKVSEDMYGNIEAKGPEMPGWVKSGAKLLNGGSEGQDWSALAGKLGRVYLIRLYTVAI